jgi:hypothetical protein
MQNTPELQTDNYTIAAGHLDVGNGHGSGEAENCTVTKALIDIMFV